MDKPKRHSMKKQVVFLPILILFCSYSVSGQENFAKNIEKRIVQAEIVYISFEVSPSPDDNTFTVTLAPKIDGQIIRVTEAYGDVGRGILPGKREIVWYYKTDFDGDINEVVFDVYAYEEEKPSTLIRIITEPSGDYQRHKNLKNIWLGGAVASAAFGGYAIIRSNSLYNDYQTATDDADKIRKKFKTLDVVSPIAFVITGVSVSQYFIQSKKQKEAEKMVNFHISPLNDGAVLSLTFNF